MRFFFGKFPVKGGRSKPHSYDKQYNMQQPLPNRRSIRMQGYDYSGEGLYFVTTCVQNMKCLLGKVVDGEMVLNDAGEIAKQCWLDIPNHFLHIVLHEFIIMPNHVHSIPEITHSVGANNYLPENTGKESHSPPNTTFRSPSKTIGSVIRGFKIGVTKWIRNNKRTKDFSSLQESKSIWQRNYYEHIIRNYTSYINIAEYIQSNPMNWTTDNYYVI